MNVIFLGNYAIDMYDKPFLMKNKKSGMTLYKFCDIPHYLQDNEFIHNYYRAYITHTQCWYSILKLHNEVFLNV
jgi:hypothetical protein